MSAKEVLTPVSEILEYDQCKQWFSFSSRCSQRFCVKRKRQPPTLHGSRPLERLTYSMKMRKVPVVGMSESASLFVRARKVGVRSALL
jgi:hypothetical protein